MVGVLKTYKMNNINNIFKEKTSGFTLIELIIGIGMMATLSGLIFPSFLNWIRTEKVNAYTRELREYFRVVRLNARRWGSSCNVNINEIEFSDVVNDKQKYGFSVNCSDQNTKINAIAPSINNSIFQIINNDFKITPNGIGYHSFSKPFKIIPHFESAFVIFQQIGICWSPELGRNGVSSDKNIQIPIVVKIKRFDDRGVLVVLRKLSTCEIGVLLHVIGVQ